MREVQVHTWCDDPTHTSKTEATTEVSLDFGPEKVTLDLCRGHWNEMRSTYSRIGVAHKAIGRPKLVSLADRTCPICGRVSPTRSAMGAHVKSQHNTRLSILTKQAKEADTTSTN